MIDVRGPRFAAWLTTAVLVAALALSGVAPTTTTVLLALQTVVFAAGALLGVRRSPYAVLFRTVVAPRLGPVREREDERPPRFAQAVGLVFGLVATLGFALGAPVVGLVAGGLALAAAFLNAVFGLCLGCEAYVLLLRARGGALTT